MGGLGNQLFIIFSTINESIINNKKFEIYIPPNVNTSLDKIVRTSDYEIKEILFKIKDKITETKPDHKYNIILSGYMQKQYGNNFEKICYITGIRDYQYIIKKKHDYLFNDKQINVSIHFRQGDYVTANKIDNRFYLLSYNYYSNCVNKLLQKFPKINIQFLIFFEKEEDNINNIIFDLKNNYNIKYKVIDSSYSTSEQLILQSLCNHNIIANSTFSLWSAYLNNNIDKTVFFPPKRGFKNFISICKQLNFEPVNDEKE